MALFAVVQPFRENRSMPWVLHILGEDAERESVSLPDTGTVVVGRSRSCDVRLHGDLISREHCRLHCSDECWSVEDLGSRNGTYVNGERVKQAALRTGDRIYVGRMLLRIVSLTTSDSGQDEQREKGSSQDSIAPQKETAKRLGRRYDLGEMFHQGATGAFYRATDIQSDRPVCVKVLARHATENDADLKRFVRGLRSAAELHHPNIVQVYHAGKTREGSWWLASEYVDGPSVRQLASKVGVGRMLPPARVLAIARDVTEALRAASQRQIIHRNIKPDNILLTKDEVAKLNNFTLARGVVLNTLQQITVSGELVGDLAYMAPELMEPGEQGDCRADLYGLGACLYVLLTGRPPHTGRGKVDLIEKVRHDEPVPPSKYNLSVGGPLEGVVLKCLAKSPTDRSNSPDELATELERIAKFRTI